MTHRAAEEVFDMRGAARRCAVSLDTIRRRLRAGELPRASRGSGPNDPWRIPIGDLVAAGLIGPSAPETSLQAQAPSDLIGHVAVLNEVIAVLARQIKTINSLIKEVDGVDQPQLTSHQHNQLTEGGSDVY